MKWAKSEYILKGVFLGLLLFVSLQNLDWPETGRLALFLGGGLGLGLLIGALGQYRTLPGLFRNPVGYFLFLLLENPLLIYGGIILGLGAGTVDYLRILYESIPEGTPKPEETTVLGFCVLGGAVLGYGLGELRQATAGYYRLALAMLVCASVGAGIYYWIDQADFLADPSRRVILGMHLLMGIPFFYMLVFAGVAEESEVEIAALCATLGLGLFLVKFPKNMPSLPLILPVGLYCVYTIRVMKPLRVFKYTLRGYSHNEVGQIRSSLAAFNRALQLDPRNHTAKAGLVRLHRNIQVDQLDNATKRLLNPNLCVTEAANYLLAEATPTADHLRDANALLKFVADQWPEMKANTDYYRVISDTHARDLDAAAERLSNLLDPAAWPAGDIFRDAILFDAWQLALRAHPTLKTRVGNVQINLPGRRMEALRAIQRQLRTTPTDHVVLDFRAELFDPLTEEEYKNAASTPLIDFSYEFAEERGLALAATPDHWQQGMFFLRVAAHGQPERSPGLFLKLAEVSEQHGEKETALDYRRKIRDVGQAFGPTNMAADQQKIYFDTVKKLGEEATKREDWPEAIRNVLLSTQAENSGKETLRTLAQLYENNKQVMLALRTTEDALTRGADKDLNERKDRYYYSVEPAELKIKAEDVRSYFDTKYCIRKAKQLLDGNSQDLDVIDWANHLATLATVMEPNNLVGKVQMARCHLRRGERDDAMRLLEDVNEMKPSGEAERDAWEWTLRQIGGLYLDEYNRPDLAVEVLLKFSGSEKSGARTLYDLGRAYEANNDLGKALAYYHQAASFEDNPIRWDAEDAIRRLKERGATPSELN
ncbi:tetratricopeptide repeat protein [Zavarzinella formosa]|uniref:tetratricopeptide repeat protein n=1 Tax=Zavarzinella formosa TaxID=360055 RepID=UPI0002FCE64A|nr:hypothetical protein [Zavarzinella formosa]